MSSANQMEERMFSIPVIPPSQTDAYRPASSASGTVLIVDDDDDFRCAVAEALAIEGYDVIHVASGEAALAALDEASKSHVRRPDMLVLDLLMPKMNGLEVLQRLRRTAQWRDLAVLVVTGVNDPMLAVRLDVPIAFKPDIEAVLDVIRRRLVNDRRHSATP